MLTAALTDETRGLLSREHLARLPDGSVIINIARGGLIDLDALTQRSATRAVALRSRRHRSPGTAARRTSLAHLPGAIVTPHVAASNRRVRHDIAEMSWMIWTAFSRVTVSRTG